MRKIFILLLIFSSIMTVRSQCVCDPPKNPIANLHDTAWYHVKLQWENPDCLIQPGEDNADTITLFNIYRNDDLIGTSTELFFLDSLSESGTYLYEISAVWSTECESQKVSIEVLMKPNPCDGITQLPYEENFEDYYNVKLPHCWKNLSDESWNPQIANDYSGGRSKKYLQFGSSSNTFNLLVLPRITMPINSLRLSFRLLRNNSTGSLDIGIMTDPEDPASFELIRTFSPEHAYAWEEFVLYFNEYYETGEYIAFRSDKRRQGLSNSIYLDEIILEEYTPCSPPTNLSISNVGGNSARISWIRGTLDSPEEIMIEYKETDSLIWNQTITPEDFIILTGLNENSNYQFRISSVCGGEPGEEYLTGSFTTGCITGGEQTFGDQVIELYQLPIDNDNNYSLSQQIFLASELEGATTLRGLAFDYAFDGAVEGKNKVAVYLAHTTKSQFNSGNDWDNAPLTPVYNGSLNSSKGWNEIYFDTLFDYNGSDNLLIVVCDSSNRKAEYGNRSTYYTDSVDLVNRAIFFTSNWEVPDVNNYPVSGSLFYTNYRNRIKFLKNCDPVSACPAPNLIIQDITSKSIEIRVVPTGQPASWHVVYKAEEDLAWITAGIENTDTVFIDNLDDYTQYMVKVMPVCSSGTPDTAFLEFRTECRELDTLPWIENFDHYDYGAPFYPIPDCWERVSTGANQVRITDESSHSSPASLQFGPPRNGYAVATLPSLASQLNINEVEVSFYLKGIVMNQFIEIGVMEDPMDINTFEPIERITLPYSWSFYTVPFKTYSGTGRYIAFKSDGSIGSNGGQVYYMDDVRIDSISDCTRPLSFKLNNPTQYGISVSWNPDEDALGYEIVYGIQGFDPDTATTVAATDTFFHLNGLLIPNSRYEIYVRSVCSDISSSVWSYPLEFDSECETIKMEDLPHFEDFNNWGSGAPSYPIPTCWSKLNSGTTSAHPFVFRNVAFVDPALRLTNPYMGYSVAVTPRFDDTLPLDTLELNFRIYTVSQGNSLIVGAVSDPQDFSTFDTLGILTPYLVNRWYDAQLFLDSYEGNGKYIAFMSPEEFYIDDLSISFIPECRIPKDLSATEVSGDTAVIAWDAVTSQSEWILYCTRMGSNNYQDTSFTVSENPFILRNLTGSSLYKVEIKGICGSDTTEFSSPVYFTTDGCGNRINEFPHKEGFEYEGNRPPCWTEEYVMGNKSWVYTKGTPVHMASPSDPHEGKLNAALFTQSGVSPTTKLITPQFDFTDLRAPYLTFWYALDQYSGNIDGLFLYYKTEESGEWSELKRYETQSHITGWQFDSIPLPEATGNYWIAFEGSYGRSGGVLLDDITIDDIQCHQPQDIQITYIPEDSAVISWSSDGFVEKWEVEYRIKGEDTYQQDESTETEFHLGGLTSDTVYHIRIRAVCGEDFTSDYTEAEFQTWITYYIQADAGDNGSISPEGTIPVKSGSSKSFTFIPDDNYVIDEIVINNILTDHSGNSYTFHNIQGDSSIRITFKMITAITENDRNQSVVLYPNPSQNVINVEMNTTFENYEIYNLFGQLMEKNDITDRHFRINISSFTSGVYFIRLTGSHETVTRKFIKE